jgi:hypothetical protein
VTREGVETSDNLRTMATRRAGQTTHVLKYDGGVLTMEIGPGRDINVFSDTLSRFNGVKPWALTLTPLPKGMDYGEMLTANIEATQFLQARGSADAMTVEIRKPGGEQWGVESVWYVIGHPHEGKQVSDVPIQLPRGAQMVSQSEGFAADEAAELFFTYYTTGDIPTNYTLRPLNGWTADGVNVDLRGQAR